MDSGKLAATRCERVRSKPRSEASYWLQHCRHQQPAVERGLKSAAGPRHFIEVEDRTVTHVRQAKFQIGQIVRHRFYPFRGVIFDVDPEFANTEEWWLSIPENVRPSKDQPFYHLLAENAESTYVAYVSEQNLLPDDSGEPVSHPQVDEIFIGVENGRYLTRRSINH
jgi:heat shock protein HspQ